MCVVSYVAFLLLRLIEVGGNDIGEEAEVAIMKAQMHRPLLDIVYRIGGGSGKRYHPSVSPTMTSDNGG